MNLHKLAAIAATTVLALTLNGCASANDDDAADGPLALSSAFYALTFIAEEVAGDRASVTQLTPVGVSPHDLELSPATVLELGQADLAFYLSDFQEAVDDAVAETGVGAFDIADVIDFRTWGDNLNAEHHASGDETAKDAGARDPHFWQDPLLMAELGHALAEELGELDPAGAETYAANAEAFAAEMAAIDADYTETLASCERDTIVVTHAAYGYMAARYGLAQVSMSGIDPDSEPSPATLLSIQEIVAETGVTTIFTEDEVMESVASAIADDTGAAVAVLATGGATEEDDDYVSLMNRNLDALSEALACG